MWRDPHEVLNQIGDSHVLTLMPFPTPSHTYKLLTWHVSVSDKSVSYPYDLQKVQTAKIRCHTNCYYSLRPQLLWKTRVIQDLGIAGIIYIQNVYHVSLLWVNWSGSESTRSLIVLPQSIIMGWILVPINMNWESLDRNPYFVTKCVIVATVWYDCNILIRSKSTFLKIDNLIVVFRYDHKCVFTFWR